MSWANNVTPAWLFEVEREHELAKMAGAFEEEWRSGTSKELPTHLIPIDRATFRSHEFGGWNYNYTKEEIEKYFPFLLKK